MAHLCFSISVWLYLRIEVKKRRRVEEKKMIWTLKLFCCKMALRNRFVMFAQQNTNVVFKDVKLVANHWDCLSSGLALPFRFSYLTHSLFENSKNFQTKIQWKMMMMIRSKEDTEQRGNRDRDRDKQTIQMCSVSIDGLQ